MELYHYTINTKHLRISPRSEIVDDVIDQMKEFLDKVIPSDIPVSLTELVPTDDFKPYSVWFNFHSKTNSEAQVEFLVGKKIGAKFFLINNSKSLWQFCRTINLPRPERPQLPACFVQLFPDELTPDSVDWLGDFERCLAWAWFERLKH